MSIPLLRGRHKRRSKFDYWSITLSDRDTSHTYEYTSQALTGGERCKERPFMHQGFDCRARQAGHFTHVELAVFFPGSTKCKSIATVRTCVWQQIQMSKRLVPFTCYIFHGFATRLSGCIIIFLKDFLLVQLSLRLHGLSTRLCSRKKSAVRA